MGKSSTKDGVSIATPLGIQTTRMPRQPAPDSTSHGPHGSSNNWAKQKGINGNQLGECIRKSESDRKCLCMMRTELVWYQLIPYIDNVVRKGVNHNASQCGVSEQIGMFSWQNLGWQDLKITKEQLGTWGINHRSAQVGVPQRLAKAFSKI